MTDRARMILNELMGINRDKIFDDAVNIDFENQDICKYNLVGFCPFIFFKNTKAGLKSCKYKLHDEYLKIAYIKANYPNIKKYEIGLIKILENILVELEIKKEKERDRLNKKGCDNLKIVNKRELELQSMGLESVIIGYLKDIESLCQNGKFEEAYNLISQYEKMKTELIKLKEIINGSTVSSDSHVVCDTCGVLIDLKDIHHSQERHKIGRLHRGYEMVRLILGEFYIKYKKKENFYITHERMEEFKKKKLNYK
ncbi:Luc7-like protein 3 [Astathelohania contejeani]|uniref:Luc7-like protein 3 n=1 Tax=Astathelohania contejeani TaxID=164912 RepID=A0ABQ7I2H1_9MICR|nr:Luc7-like protein 3 [Thelohania contejeani]